MSRARMDDPSHLRLLLAMLQHEVRTPLNAIVGFAELLRPDMPDDELLETVKRIRSSARALDELVNAIPALSGLDSDSAPLEDRPFAPVELLDDVFHSFRQQAADKQIELTVRIDRRIPGRLLGAPGLLRQVLANLLGNAVKFTDDGRIQLVLEQMSTTDRGVRVRYAVADTGRGVPPELQSTILEPFERGEAATSANESGSGLGLSICVKLLRAMDSRIEIESLRGQGSTFSFEVFHPHPEPEHRDVGVRDPSACEEQTPRALIVEDDDDNRELLRRLVEREGFAVDLASDGWAAISAVERRDYAILFSDIRMSGMDGLELAKEIRKREAASGKSPLHLVAVTAGGLLMKPEHRALQERFDTILLKPLRQRVLSRILAPFRTTGASSGQANVLELEPVDTAVIDLVPDFLARRDDDLAVLRAFLSGRASLKDVSIIGHNMRGSALSFGFPRLATVGGSLEAAAQAGDILRITSLIEEMERLVERAKRGTPTMSELERPRSGSAPVVPIRRN